MKSSKMFKLSKQVISKPFLQIPKAGHMYVKHRNSDINTEATPFDFTTENYKKVDEILAKFPTNYKQSACIPLLTLAQKQNDNFLSLAAMNKVAKIMDVRPMFVYETATFYTMFNREKLGKFHLQICGTTPCMVRGAQDIIKAAEEFCGTTLDHTSIDKLFTISEVECLGACVNAPMMQVNNEEYYEDLDPQNMKDLLQKFKTGKEAKPGPQIPSRKNAEGPLGRTTLTDINKINQITDRDFGKVKADWEQKQKEAAEAAAAKK